MRTRTSRRAALGVATAVLASMLLGPDAPADTVAPVVEAAHQCGKRDRVEPGLQGDVPRAAQESNAAYGGYNCGLALVGHATLGKGRRAPTGNANMAWVDDCAYVAGSGAVFGPAGDNPTGGVAVVDVSDPAHPRHVRTLRTPGALNTMETLHAVETRDRAVLVVGEYGNAMATEPKPMDVYDVSDCSHPRKLQTFRFPENIHNLTISGNGRYVFATQPIQVVDLDPLFDDDPATKAIYLGNLEAEIPAPFFATGPVADADDALPAELRDQSRSKYLSHEVWPSRDGSRIHVGGQLPTFETFSIVEIGRWLRRDADGRPAGPPEVLSQRSGRGHSVRTARIDGRKYALHSEESVFMGAYGCMPEELNPFAGPAEPWLTDITDPRDPRRVSQFGLEINQPENCAAQWDSGVNNSVHYHDVDDPQDTTFVMASMWNSGLRIFDVRDPARPVEVGYFNPADLDPGADVALDQAWGHVRYVPETGHIWFATESGGFWVVELEPKLRRHLELDVPERPSIVHPMGRAGFLGTGISVPAALRIDAAPYYCTLGLAQAAAA